MSNQLLFEIKNLRCSYDKNFQEGKSKVVLEIDHFSIPRGRKVFIVGESGIGKSTILETLGMMNNTIVQGENTRFIFYDVDESPIDLVSLWKSKGEKRLSDFRLKNYSFIFQNTNLMRNFTAFENVAFTRMLQGYPMAQCFHKTRFTLDSVGLNYIDKTRMAHELSGGQQQRLAFARAILPDFAVLFGDEPTGNLDSENAVRVMQILSDKLGELGGASAVIVSHDMHLSTTFADIIVKIQKRIRPRCEDADEEVSYGVIDSKSVFTCDAERKIWTNGYDVFETEEFESYLRSK